MLGMPYHESWKIWSVHWTLCVLSIEVDEITCSLSLVKWLVYIFMTKKQCGTISSVSNINIFRTRTVEQYVYIRLCLNQVI